jgi:AAA domain/RepB DNA-primase from phage plasmid
VSAVIDLKLKENGVSAADYLRDWGHTRTPEERSYLQSLANAINSNAPDTTFDTDQYIDFYNYVSKIGQPGDTLCFVGIQHNEDKSKEKIENEFVSYEKATTREYFHELQRSNAGASIYLAMNTFPATLIGHKTGRTQENVVHVRAVQADVDFNGGATLDAIKSSDQVPPPSIIVESSPGKFQGIWLVDDISKVDAKPLMQAIAATFNTDSAVAEVARVMRVPGFVNRKYPTAPVARTVSQSNARYTRAAFRVSMPEPKKIELRPENWVNDVVVTHGNAYNDLLSLAGYYVRQKNINDPEMLYKLLAGHCEHAVDRDGKTPWQPNMDQVKGYANKWAGEFETKEQFDARTKITLNQTSTNTANVVAPIEITPELLLKEFPAYDGTEPDELPMLIQGFMPKGVGFFGSLSGTGKTWVGLSVTKALTSGMPLWEMFPVKRKTSVLYLIPEASDASFKRRLGKMRISQDKNLFRYRTITQGITRPLSDPMTVAMVQQLGATHDVLVVVDTAVRFFFGGDENAAKENNLVKDSDMLRSIGANVLFLHHSPKATKDAAELTLENALRGTGDFGAMADFVYAFRRDEKLFSQGEGPEEIEVVCVKPRDFEPPLPFRLQLKRKAKHGEPGPIVSVIDQMGDLAYVGHAAVKDDHFKMLAAIFHENPFISFNDLVNLLKMKRELVRGFCKRNGNWKQVEELFAGSRGRAGKRKRWTQGLVMGGQVEQTSSAPDAQSSTVQSGPSVNLAANAVTFEDASVGF